jgi:hypothetical protein
MMMMMTMREGGLLFLSLIRVVRIPERCTSSCAIARVSVPKSPISPVAYLACVPLAWRVLRLHTEHPRHGVHNILFIVHRLSRY